MEVQLCLELNAQAKLNLPRHTERISSRLEVGTEWHDAAPGYATHCVGRQSLVGSARKQGCQRKIAGHKRVREVEDVENGCTGFNGHSLVDLDGPRSFDVEGFQPGEVLRIRRYRRELRHHPAQSTHIG